MKPNKKLKEEEEIVEDISANEEEEEMHEDDEETDEADDDVTSEDDDEQVNGEDDNDEKEEKDEEEENEGKDDMKESIKMELNKMSFEEIQKFQNKLGLKKFKEVMSQENQKENQIKTFKRLNKNRPREISSKKPVSTIRNVFQVKKPRGIIDPRYNAAMGEYKPDLFRKRYSFVNEMRKNEIKELTEQLRNDQEADQTKRALLKSAIMRLKQQVKSFEQNEKKEEMAKKLKSMAREDAKEGRKPQFVTKSDLRILELAEKYKQLKKNGKVENFLAKKRKKQLSKDMKKL